MRQPQGAPLGYGSEAPVPPPCQIVRGPACCGPRYQRGEQLPLVIGEFMTTCHPTMIHDLMIFEDGP